MSVLSLLATNNYITVNKQLIKEVGLEEAIVFGVLCSTQNYCETNNQLKDGYFYCTVKSLEEATTLSRYKQDKAITHLAEQGYLTTKLMGMPALRYIKIIEEKVVDLFFPRDKNTENQDVKNFNIRCEKIKHQDVKKFNTNNNIYNKNKDNNNTISKEIVEEKSSSSSVNNSNSVSDTLNDDVLTNDDMLVTDKKLKGKRISRFEKCMLYVNDFTDNEELTEVLKDYLTMRLQMKDKPMYVNQWKALLTRLNNTEGDNVEIVRQSLEHGWASFYPIHQYNKSTTNRFKDNMQADITEHHELKLSDKSF